MTPVLLPSRREMPEMTLGESFALFDERVRDLRPCPRCRATPGAPCNWTRMHGSRPGPRTIADGWGCHPQRYPGDVSVADWLARGDDVLRP